MHAHTHLLGGEGRCVECVELMWDFRAGRWLQSKAHLRAPESLEAAPVVRRSGANAHFSSERGVGVPCAYIIALSLTRCLGFLVLVLVFFGKV